MKEQRKTENNRGGGIKQGVKERVEEGEGERSD